MSVHRIEVHCDNPHTAHPPPTRNDKWHFVRRVRILIIIIVTNTPVRGLPSSSCGDVIINYVYLWTLWSVAFVTRTYTQHIILCSGYAEQHVLMGVSSIFPPWPRQQTMRASVNAHTHSVPSSSSVTHKVFPGRAYVHFVVGPLAHMEIGGSSGGGAHTVAHLLN